MNIFFLDKDHKKCAEYHVDRHVMKIIIESLQLVAAAYPGVTPYKRTYENHPMSLFCRKSLSNFNWILDYCFALCHEYTFRYGKIHKSEAVANWYRNNPPNLPDLGFTEPPRCFGEWKGKIKEVDGNIIEEYREYYVKAKAKLFSWRNREKPYWIQDQKTA